MAEHPDRTAAGSTLLAHGYFAVLATVIAAAVLLPVGRLGEDLVYSAVGVSVIAALLTGIRRHQPRSARAWYLMVAGQSLWVVADASYNLQQDLLHVTTFPTISDAFYLLGYPLFALGLWELARERSRDRRDLGPILDAATVTVGLGVLSWVLLARPTIANIHHSPFGASVAAAYPVMDILLAGALVRLVGAPGGRSIAFRYLMAALTLLVIADTFSVSTDRFTTNTISGVEYLWLLSYAAWGAAALHPSMAKLADPVTQPETGFRGVRLLSVVVATLLAPAILAVHQITGVPIDLWAVIVGSVVMFLLVVVRMNLAITTIASVNQSLEVLQDELAVQATHDPLTFLANRTQSMRMVAGALGRARRHDGSVALLFIDLDGFKDVNDNHGHRAGDEVLREVARRMEHVIREGDFVGRLGGDEFLVGIEDVTEESDAITLANRLIAAIRQEIHLHDHTSVQVGASVGIAVGRGGETDVEALLHEADQAVYQAKAAGRGRVELFNGQARAALRQRNDIERALIRAIAEDELVLHYQPIVRLSTGRVESYEALVRWQRPGFGLLSPDEFLPYAEASDLICDLDTWVLRKAISQLEQWNLERGDYALQVAVNISGRHISQHRIADDVAGALRSAVVIPPQLIIEVTETAPLDGTAASTNVDALRAMGAVISLDDFGTGYQSSAQLSRLPVDMLKIDRKFVQAESATERSLLELMVKTAHAFGVRVVAEGVEHAEQLVLLRELGCEYVQGYYLGRPVPAENLVDPDPTLLIAS